MTGVNQFVYTAQFGNGVSGTFGVQDPTQYYQAGVFNFGAAGVSGATNPVSGVALVPASMISREPFSRMSSVTSMSPRLGVWPSCRWRRMTTQRGTT